MSQLSFAKLRISSALYIFTVCRRTHPLMHFSTVYCNRSCVVRHGGVIFHLLLWYSLFFFLCSVRFGFSVVYSARGDFSERGLDEVSAIHGDPRLPTLGPGHLGPCSRDVLTVRLLKSTTTSTHYIVAR